MIRKHLAALYKTKGPICANCVRADKAKPKISSKSERNVSKRYRFSDRVSYISRDVHTTTWGLEA